MTATREQLIEAKRVLEGREWFYYNELSEKAQEKVRTRYVMDLELDFECVSDDMLEVCERLGVKLTSPGLRWSGFFSQGDGASFIGDYAYAKNSRKLIAAHAPQDEELNRIAKVLHDTQRPNFYVLTAKVYRTDRHYAHERSVGIDVYDARSPGGEASEDKSDVVAEALRDLMRWFYASLEAEYEYQTGDGAKEYLSTCDETAYDEEGNEWSDE